MVSWTIAVELTRFSGMILQFVRVIAMCLVAQACDHATISPVDNGDTVSVRDSLTWLHTSSVAYELSGSGNTVGGAVPFSFTNPLPDTVYFVNCHRELSMILLQFSGAAWQSIWSRPSSLCLSAPIAIPPGSTFRDTLSIEQLPVSRLAQGSTYRLKWTNNLVTHYNGSSPSFGLPIPDSLLHSNRFGLGIGPM